MKRKHFILFSIFLLTNNYLCVADEIMKEINLTLSTASGEIVGILREPHNSTQTVAIIISGAARTDRDGNQPQTKNNSLKMLAEDLVKKDIAVLNFDKRGVGLSQLAGSNEDKITLDTYVSDVKEWIKLLKKEKYFDNIVVIGHAEGALIGMLASIDNSNVSKFISIGGTSKKASDITREQFASMPANVKNIIYQNIDRLEKGERIERVPQEWNVLFRSGLQPYLISLYKHNPKEEISKVSIPVLIIQGDKDVQSSVEDADELAIANPKARKVIIENMNYVLKQCDQIGQEKQLNTYLKPNYPLNKDLIPTISAFILYE